MRANSDGDAGRGGDVVGEIGEVVAVGVAVDGGEDSEGEGGEEEEREEDEKGQIFERARAVIVGDLEVLGLVFVSFGDGGYGWWFKSGIWFGEEGLRGGGGGLVMGGGGRVFGGGVHGDGGDAAVGLFDLTTSCDMGILDPDLIFNFLAPNFYC